MVTGVAGHPVAARVSNPQQFFAPQGISAGDVHEKETPLSWHWHCQAGSATTFLQSIRCGLFGIGALWQTTASPGRAHRNPPARPALPVPKPPAKPPPNPPEPPPDDVVVMIEPPNPVEVLDAVVVVPEGDPVVEPEVEDVELEPVELEPVELVPVVGPGPEPLPPSASPGRASSIMRPPQ
jgi:hypothetical protein